MRQMIAAGVKVQCIVTSPPYWGLRDYGVTGQFGLERTWVRHVARMRGVFRLARELLSDDGTCWMNYGDSYAGAPGGYQGKSGQRASRTFTAIIKHKKRGREIKPKDLIGMPWRVAFSLQADGWWLRSDIIWHKTSPMPETVRDRPTKAHEYLFLLSKSPRYHYDASAIAEPTSANSHARAARAGLKSYAPPGQHPHEGIVGSRPGVNPKSKVPAGWDAVDHGRGKKTGRYKNQKPRSKQNESFSAAVVDVVETRNARTVWTIASEPASFAHFATFPRELVRRAILAGSRPGDIVFDPFMGSGTVAEVALSLGRRYIGTELNPAYAAMFKTHRSQQQGMPI